MCGIGVIWDRSGQWYKDINKGRDVPDMGIVSRGPDGKGVWIGREYEPILFHRRLSIQDLSNAGHQPMISRCGRYVTVFNGEVYNVETLRHFAEDRGWNEWKSTSDTEVLVACISINGVEETVSQIDGMFAIACWDRKEQRLYIMRDRFGEKPLYYGYCGDTFGVSSTCRMFGELAKHKCQVNEIAAARMIMAGYVEGEDSIIENVRRLSPGRFAKLCKDEINRRGFGEVKSFWKYNEVNRINPGSPVGSDVQDLDNVLSESVERCLVGDREIGCLLSGGIDSTLISAIATRKLGVSLKTFSMAFSEPGYDESGYAREVAEELCTDHSVFTFDSKSLVKTVLELANIWDEPYADQSQIAMSFLCKEVSNDVAVALTGDGGDEMLCGYNRYHRGLSLYRTITKNGFLRTGARLAAYMPFESLDFLSRKLPRKYHFSALRSLVEKTNEVADCTSLMDYYMKVASRANQDLTRSEIREAVERERTSYMNKLFEVEKTEEEAQTLMRVDRRSYLPDDILVKSDRASMHYGLSCGHHFWQKVLNAFLCVQKRRIWWSLARQNTRQECCWINTYRAMTTEDLRWDLVYL